MGMFDFLFGKNTGDSHIGKDSEVSDDVGDLILASKIGREADVRSLIIRGVNVNGRKNGVSALIHASYAGYIDIVQALLEAGADVNERIKGTLPEWHLLKRKMLK